VKNEKTNPSKVDKSRPFTIQHGNIGKTYVLYKSEGFQNGHLQ